MSAAAGRGAGEITGHRTPIHPKTNRVGPPAFWGGERAGRASTILMALVIDTGPLLAALDAADPDHERCAGLLSETKEDLVVPISRVPFRV